MPGFVRNQWLSLPFRKELVEYDRGDVSPGYFEGEHNPIELSWTCESPDCCLAFNIIEIQLSFHSLCIS